VISGWQTTPDCNKGDRCTQNTIMTSSRLAFLIRNWRTWGNEKSTGVLAVVVLVAGCQSSGGYKPVSEKLPELTVSFNDAAWNGKTVPSGQNCKKDGGNGSTPALMVSGIPAGANAIIVEFNDESYGPLSSGGGHGKIGHTISGGGKASLQAVPGETDTMPSGVFLEAGNRATGAWAADGYLPPCSGGKGNFYSATLKAVYKAKAEGEASKLFATGKIGLGTY
jgi:hypothetical protein